MNEIQDNKLLKIASSTKEYAGTTSSYVLTGTVYTGEFILKIAAGVVVGLALCSPALLIDASSSGGTSATNTCFNVVAGAPLNYLFEKKSLGKVAYEKTNSWRCPLVKPLTHSIIKIANCYSELKTAEGNLQAKNQLTVLSNDIDFIRCADTSDKEKVRNSLAQLQNEKSSKI